MNGRVIQELADALAGPIAEVLPGLTARIAGGPGGAVGLLAVDLAGVRIVAPPELTRHARAPRPVGRVTVARVVGAPEIAAAVIELDRFAPDARRLVAHLVAALAVHPTVEPLLSAGEREAARLGLAAAVALVVVRAADPPVVGVSIPGVVGLALDAVARIRPSVSGAVGHAAAVASEEPGPSIRDGPERAYRWVQNSILGMAATITVVVGVAPGDVLTAFDADAVPVPLDLLRPQAGLIPWLALRERDGAVIVIEENGWRGSEEDVVARLSRSGIAASVYWNVNGMRRQTFARRGQVLGAFEWLPDDLDDELRGVYAGLDLEDFEHVIEKHLIALERFTGVAVTEGDVQALDGAGVGHRLPDR